ncbi:MAG: hypothetical protein JWO58_1317 [Chitinophagaceae bacterium]|nr:hypothetical protein [Chitinophagaceae bacterium]
MLTIVVPCYNEESNIDQVFPSLVAFVKENNFYLRIVNDGSKDRTQQLLNRYEDGDSVKVIHHKVNRGYGGALKSGIKASDTEYVITIDADGQHAVEDVLKLYRAIQDLDADMIVGRRGKELSKVRSIGKFFIRTITKILISDVAIHDINSGMKIYKTSIVKKYLNLCPNGMAFSDVITLMLVNDRFLVTEEPISIRQRLGGKSTIGIQTVFQTIYEVINIVMYFNPIRIFLPISILLVVFGMTWSIPILLDGRGLSVGGSFFIISGVQSFLIGLIAEQNSVILKKLKNED